ncbi:hypothetical protein MG293_017251 [Ovis ammon polii]|uniref:Uncharacterized protein n=1 Tax=Ovis ammon polii TaxID=230172 RepID=A0AAD4Y352_OVIAM|nr:hypothetical protein MG293_017251 [Ovis ammon polii]
MLRCRFVQPIFQQMSERDHYPPSSFIRQSRDNLLKCKPEFDVTEGKLKNLEPLDTISLIISFLRVSFQFLHTRIFPPQVAFPPPALDDGFPTLDQLKDFLSTKFAPTSPGSPFTVRHIVVSYSVHFTGLLMGRLQRGGFLWSQISLGRGEGLDGGFADQGKLTDNFESLAQVLPLGFTSDSPSELDPLPLCSRELHVCCQKKQRTLYNPPCSCARTTLSRMYLSLTGLADLTKSSRTLALRHDDSERDEECCQRLMANANPQGTLKFEQQPLFTPWQKRALSQFGFLHIFFRYFCLLPGTAYHLINHK